MYFKSHACFQDVSPGFWLSTVSEERYEVTENKSTKKVFFSDISSAIVYKDLRVFFFDLRNLSHLVVYVNGDDDNNKEPNFLW